MSYFQVSVRISDLSDYQILTDLTNLLLYTGKYLPDFIFPPICLLSVGFKPQQTSMSQIISLNTTVSGPIQDGAKLFAGVEGKNYMGQI